MSESLPPLAKKAYEVGYAVFRVSSILSSKAFSEALQQEGIHLLWNALRGSGAGVQSGAHALHYLISFGKDTGIIHPENAELLSRQLEALSFLATSSSQIQGEPVLLNLNEVFSGTDAPEVTKAANAATKARSAPASKPYSPKANLVLGPAQKERQAMILEKIGQSGNCRTGELQAVFPNLSERTLRYDLQRLVEEGKIERGGAGPASWYRLRAPQDTGGMIVPERNVPEAASL